MEPETHTISVRELVEFIDRRGDIDFRFSARSTAIEGIRGHQRVQRRRTRAHEGYVSEKTVTCEHDAGAIRLVVSGRVDGHMPDANPMLVEEIKTVRTEARTVPHDVRGMHWGQARAYACMLAREHDRDAVVVRLCYLELDDDSEHLEERIFTRDELESYFTGVLDAYAAWIARTREWRRRRDETIAALTFPYGDYRAGQREVAVSVYRTIQRGGQLVIQAPTGIGKTMAVTFPAVKAMATLGYDKVFYLTAKGSGQEMASRTVADMKAQGLVLRDITITAKDKICFNPGSPCDPDHCEYAKGYYDRLPAVLTARLDNDESLSREAIERIARDHTLCPFELSLDLSRIADLVVCDYNYVFDPTVYLRRYFEDVGGRYAMLVDEAHNLVDRGREMFSARLDKADYLSVRKALKAAQPQLARRLARVNEAILALRRGSRDAFERDGHLRLDEVPPKLIAALRQFCSAAEDWLQRGEPASYQPMLLQLYFDSLRFMRVSEWFDDNYACLLIEERGGLVVKLTNLNPAPGLKAGLARVDATVCFSATMSPQAYFRALLGVEEGADWYRVPSPFDPDNLGVYIASWLSTALRDRDAGLDDLADLIADVAAGKAGNYLVFFPSHAYLGAVHDRFRERHPDWSTVMQTASMDAGAREAFLANFECDARRTSLIGFAVMGGIFGEGIDLPGTRLIGVVIAGVGLPQLGVERDMIRDYFDNDDAGFEFAYQYPGMNRVLQTAGRVIRSNTDRGVVCLVDRRFTESRYRRMFPEEWRVQTATDRQALSEALAAFWRSPSKAVVHE